METALHELATTDTAMRTFLAFLTLSLSFSGPLTSYGSIAVDNSLIHDQTPATTSVSFSYTPTGAPSIVIVQLHDVPLSTVSAASYAGTSIFANTIPVNTADVCNAIFYAQNPPSGTQTVAITQSSSRDIETVISLTGTRLSGIPYGSIATTSGSAQNVSLTIKPQNPNSIVVDCLFKDQFWAKPGVDQTMQKQAKESGGSNFWGIVSTHFATSTTNDQFTSTTTSLMEYAIYEIFATPVTPTDYITGAKGYIKGAKGYVR